MAEVSAGGKRRIGTEAGPSPAGSLAETEPPTTPSVTGAFDSTSSTVSTAPSAGVGTVKVKVSLPVALSVTLAPARMKLAHTV
jgi:hypothetical protein